MGRTSLRAAAALFALALMAAGQLLSGGPHASAAAGQRHKRPRVDARAVYERNCARCHGREGRAETEQGELYNATKFADPEWWRRERPTNSRLRSIITHGSDGMPAFGNRLSAAQINALVPYVRSFNRK